MGKVSSVPCVRTIKKMEQRNYKEECWGAFSPWTHSPHHHHHQGTTTAGSFVILQNIFTHIRIPTDLFTMVQKSVVEMGGILCVCRKPRKIIFDKKWAERNGTEVFCFGRRKLVSSQPFPPLSCRTYFTCCKSFLTCAPANRVVAL